MKTLPPFHFMVYSVIKAIRYPRTKIAYYICTCGCRFPASEKECPKCRDKVSCSPENRKESPVPWFGSIIVIVIGIGAWITAACLNIPGLDEAARALVYIPLGSLFGMSLQR